MMNAVDLERVKVLIAVIFKKKIQKQTMQYVTIKKFSRGENNFQINLLSLPEKIQIILFVSFFFSYIVYLIIPYLI